MSAHNHFFHWPAAWTFCHMLADVSLMHCIKPPVMWTGVLYNVNIYLHIFLGHSVENLLILCGLNNMIYGQLIFNSALRCTGFQFLKCGPSFIWLDLCPQIRPRSWLELDIGEYYLFVYTSRQTLTQKNWQVLIEIKCNFCKLNSSFVSASLWLSSVNVCVTQGTRLK